MKIFTATNTIGCTLTLILLLICSLPLAAAEPPVFEQDLTQPPPMGITFSGDDAYDPAAGGRAVPIPLYTDSYSGDDAYDPAADGLARPQQNYAVTFSGDDAYDPAAGGRAVPIPLYTDSYSGDDAYDPATEGPVQALPPGYANIGR